MTIRFVGCTPAQFETRDGDSQPGTSTSSTNKRDHTPLSLVLANNRVKIPSKYTVTSGLLQVYFSWVTATAQPILDGRWITIGSFCIGRDTASTTSPISVYSVDAAGVRGAKLLELFSSIAAVPAAGMWQFAFTPTSLTVYVNEVSRGTATTTSSGRTDIEVGGSTIAATQFFSEIMLDDSTANLRSRYVVFFAANATVSGATLTGDATALYKNNPGQGLGGDAAGNTAEITRAGVVTSAIPGSFSKKTTYLCLTTDNPTNGVRIETRPTVGGAYEVVHAQAANTPATRDQIHLPTNDAYALVTDRVRATLV